MGNRDHTTVIHGHDKIGKMLETDENLKSNLDIIIKKFEPTNVVHLYRRNKKIKVSSHTGTTLHFFPHSIQIRCELPVDSCG